MLSSSFLRSLGLLALGLLLLADSGQSAPQPKAAWMRGARTRLAKSSKWNSNRWANGSACVETAPSDFQAPKENVWSGLTNWEAASVTRWLFGQAELNLTRSEDAGNWDNSILLVELMLPNKTDVLPYVDGDAAAPTRYAHVVLDLRATVNPTYTDILVGPLPVTNGTTTWQPVEYPYTRKTGGSIRNLDADSDTMQTDFILKITGSISDITLDLWGGTAMGMDNDTLDVWGIDPVWQYDNKLTRWDTFWNYPTDEFDAETLLPLGLFLKTDVTGRDPSKWKMKGWLYNDIFYPTTADFRKAYYSGNFTKLGANVEGDWARTDQQGPVLPMDTATPPGAVAPSGARYSVDHTRKYVEWMDFSFYMGFSRDTGLALYDIRHKGQRIIYELSLQEALAHYAGNDPVQSGTAYLDSYYGFGPYAFELVPGYDCPAYASFVNTSFYVSETTHTHINSVCLFEFDADYPIQSHTNSAYTAKTKNIYFTVRFVATVGNYDYSFSYEFYLDGSIRVEVRASGYIQAAYYANNHDYGYQIHDFLSGSMHDHVLGFKADLDILGTENTMELTTNVPVTENYVWSDHPRNTMKLQRSFIESEDDSRLFYTGNGRTQYRVVNTAKPNKYGEYRGYRILPSDGTIHLTVLNSSNLVDAADWANYDLMITKQKDTEPRSAHPYNGQDVYDPMVRFGDFFNGESLTQEDLVVWFNLGMHHIPHTGDLPNTVFTTAHSGIQFMPLNYYDGDISRQTVNMVRINYDKGNVSEVKTFGQKEATCSADLAKEEFDFYSYTGDVVIRKFPYDPNDPYFETDSIV
ncbi:hypothetical protein B0A55_00722 [Friedmanniomyces simplex]|uniref:Amine oxidase n=1 Tax=Friedmanniomyces simplex TaxID=329884 RepID=A0A4U0Y307_9PEZI|nr:hypothetical protein B0A55_00722 [Friedmanniomyces simplex]